MKDLIIGTAGHVDHGKTALIEALTGYNGDELAEEKERGITIDLSFSHMRRGERNVAFIDVPGHDRLVKNMVGGAFGFDGALLVVAADEGVMPQTLEHLAVLEIVGVERIVVALSKKDRVDGETLEHRREEIVALFASRGLREPLGILPVSIHDKASIEALKDFLFGLEGRAREESPFFRYYVDRVFSPRGVGTVVTGTVLGGEVRVGEKLNVAELDRPVTIRGIQIHGEERPSARTHQRAALRLDLSHTLIEKGFLLCSRGYFRGFDRIDASFTPLGEAPPHNSEVLFISGAKRLEGRLLYYDDTFVSLKLSDRVFTRFGDPYVLLHRGRVVGGGEILEAVRDPIRKRQKIPLLRALKARDFSAAFSILLANHRRGFGLISSQQRFAMDHARALEIARGIEGAFVDAEDLVLYPPGALEEIGSALRRIYEHNPRALLSPASVTLRIKWASRALVTEAMEALVAEGLLRRSEGLYLRADQSAEELLGGIERRILEVLEEEGTTPEAPYNLYDRLDLDRRRGDRALKSLTRAKKVVRLSHNLFVTVSNLQKALGQMREIMEEEGYIDIRNFKARSGMSRKYCIAYLEYLDKSGEVSREGDRRVLKYRE